MAAYVHKSVADFVNIDPLLVVGELQSKYARDGFISQYTEQSKAWERLIPLLQRELNDLLAKRRDATAWRVLLEYPLYRLRKRVDVIVLTDCCVAVIEAKVGEQHFRSEDERQVEEYALDLRDFHAASHRRSLFPILWSTEATAANPNGCSGQRTLVDYQVAPVRHAGRTGLSDLLDALPRCTSALDIDFNQWDHSPYKPVPNVIEAATSIFAGHDVRAIAQADASNLAAASRRVIEIISVAKSNGQYALIFVTGIPGSGKTLAGLQVVHDALATGAGQAGDIIYLSGNTPLVVVLREALARDEYKRKRGTAEERPLRYVRNQVRARIQHINDFLKQYVSDKRLIVPHEHVIVFDEAQRAWDEEQGKKKFERRASEPSLLLDLMAQHPDWCACICLVGGGQEINSGEEGIAGWGRALRLLPPEKSAAWTVFAPPEIREGDQSVSGMVLGDIPTGVRYHDEPDLRLDVPLRSFRAPGFCNWVAAVLNGDSQTAMRLMANSLNHYPIRLTRSLSTAKQWIRGETRGQRRCGLLASSGARRLRADGIGEILGATDRDAIAHWYLDGNRDIRSSLALEVPANEYASQGLEIDFAAVCWGGDMLYDGSTCRWRFRYLNGNRWQDIRMGEGQTFVRNSYRVLLTRAREGLVIWVPHGELNDHTREPAALDATAAFLEACGCVPLDPATASQQT